MNRWDLMEAFVRVLHAGSFSAAAVQMDVSKSLLSKKISRLERNLGTQLLVRTTRRLHPTDAGQAFFQQCERLLEEYDKAEQSMLNLDVVPSGHLRVACTDILGERYISRLAAEFAALIPQSGSTSTSRRGRWTSSQRVMTLQSVTANSATHP